MLEKIPTTPWPSKLQKRATDPIGIRLRKSESPPRVWPWLIGLLVVGLFILGVVSTTIWDLFGNLHVATTPNSAQPTVITLDVGRTVPYANLNFTVLTAQYAFSFGDDPIHMGPAVVRLNIRVTNKTTTQIAVVYYDVMRLLAPKQSPIALTNILSSGLGLNQSACSLSPVSAGPKPDTSEFDCLDFPVVRGTQLKSLSLQLGSMATGESFVTMPFSGTFNPNRYADRVISQSIDITYYYHNFADQAFEFVYHLTSVTISYAYNGTQCKAGQQFYVLTFHVDNLAGIHVVPGYAYDYVRLIFSGTVHAPVDSTLPNAYNAGARGVVGQVAFVGPSGTNVITIGLIPQNGWPMQTQDVML